MSFTKETIDFNALGANSKYNWELFFHAPLYIATQLSKNGKYQEAMKWFHYIFDPTTDETAAISPNELAHFWKVKPFKATSLNEYGFAHAALYTGLREAERLKTLLPK